MSRSFTDHLLAPIANETDARATATALEEYSYDRITVVRVVEKGGGPPDTLSVERAKMVAQGSFAAFREIVPDIETEIAYSTNIVEAINGFAVELEADAIAFRSRGGSRLVQSISSDKTLRLVSNTELPVIALHDTEEVS